MSHSPLIETRGSADPYYAFREFVLNILSDR